MGLIFDESVKKIGIVGFAGSRIEAPYNDPSWVLVGINDVYAQVPRLNATFELHATKDLIAQGRRNPAYFDWLRKGVQPVYMVDPQPDFPSAVRFPFEQVREIYRREYWTNSVAWVIAACIIDLTEEVEVAGGRVVRVARPGCQLGLWGIHMAADSEYQDQRRCCEYVIGTGDSCGLPIHIPASSELMKAASVYGLDTTEPLRRSLEAKIAECVVQGQQLDQQMMQMQAQLQQLQIQRASVTGQKQAMKALRNNWTMPTDRVPSEVEREQRHAAPSLPAGVNVPSDNQPSATEPVVVVAGSGGE